MRDQWYRGRGENTDTDRQTDRDCLLLTHIFSVWISWLNWDLSSSGDRSSTYEQKITNKDQIAHWFISVHICVAYSCIQLLPAYCMCTWMYVHHSVTYQIQFLYCHRLDVVQTLENDSEATLPQSAASQWSWPFIPVACDSCQLTICEGVET